MRRWSEEDLRYATLRRQFPDADGPLDLLDRIAPIQSQVPRSPFATFASRRPGTSYGEVVDLFERSQLIKASTLRGTVFTSTREQFVWSQRIAVEGRPELLAGQTKVPVTEVRRLLAAVEERAADWVPWDDLLEHGRALMRAGPPELAGRADQIRFVLWGQAGLLRRPPDTAWHKRTDVWRRSARVALPDLGDLLGPDRDFDTAVTAMVERHLRAYGPVSPADTCFYLGIRKTPLKRALAALGDRVITGEGPDGSAMLDLDDELAHSRDEPGAATGVRLLGEFDGCLLGYAGPGRLRFLSADQLDLVWNAKNAVCAPTVLSDGRIVARWRTVGTGRRVRLEVTMLAPYAALAEDALAPATTALAGVLDLEVREIRMQ